VFRVRRVSIDTLSEHVVFIHEGAVRGGRLGFEPLDRVRVEGRDSEGREREITGVLNFCSDRLVAEGDIGLSEVAFRDLALAEGTRVTAAVAPAPASIDRVRNKLRGRTLGYGDFESILVDVVAHRYSKVELSMFVLACALQKLSVDEVVELTRAMIATGRSLDFGAGPIADKHCVGGIPGNRTTMVLVPILAARGVRIPKTSSRAITSPAGTADTMGVLAEVALSPERLRAIVEETGGCIAWGGALDLAPADDILITVERPMEIDSEAQMIASILAKKKTAGATHALIDVPVGPSAKVRSQQACDELGDLFRDVSRAIDLTIELVATEARGPVGFGIGPRLEGLPRGPGDAGLGRRAALLRAHREGPGREGAAAGGAAPRGDRRAPGRAHPRHRLLAHRPRGEAGGRSRPPGGGGPAAAPRGRGGAPGRAALRDPRAERGAARPRTRLRGGPPRDPSVRLLRSRGEEEERCTSSWTTGWRT
jgi:thymidine phosphorylase